MRAIIGPNGAGKTTMMDVVTGKTRPDTGDVYLRRAATTSRRSTRPRSPMLGIGRKFQKPTVFEMHTVEDNLLLALKSDRRVRAHAVLARDRRTEAAASTASSTSSA